jgi:hypothetical protein
MWGLRAEKVTHNMLRTTRASSDIRLGSQGGSQTTLTSTFPTPGTVETVFCTVTGSSCADGQLGEVSVSADSVVEVGDQESAVFTASF